MATLSDILRASTQANPGSAYPYRLPPEALASLLSSQQQAAAQGAQSFNLARAQSRQDRMNAALRAKELEMGYDQKRREMANQQTEALNMRNWMEQQAAQDFQRKMQEQAAQFEQESSLESLRQKYKADAAKSLQEHNMAIAMKEIEVRQAKNQNEHDAAMRELDDLKQSRQNKLDFDIKGREMEEERRERERGESIFAAIGERRKARKAEAKKDKLRAEELQRQDESGKRALALKVLGNDKLTPKQQQQQLSLIFSGKTPENILEVIQGKSGDGPEVTAAYLLQVQQLKQEIQGFPESERKEVVEALIRENKLRREDAMKVLPEEYSFYTYPEPASPLNPLAALERLRHEDPNDPKLGLGKRFGESGPSSDDLEGYAKSFAWVRDFMERDNPSTALWTLRDSLEKGQITLEEAQRIAQINKLPISEQDMVRLREAANKAQ
jgi:hypothetical protein